MENRKWQRVPGMSDASVFPHIRRPDVLSSNSYLIEFPDRMLLIDPGALPRQTDELRHAMSDREGGRALPVMVCVTHCHLDHSREAHAWTGDPSRPACFSAQERGAQALAVGDCRQTAADLYGMEMPRVETHVPLLTEADVSAFQPRRIRLADGTDVQIRTEKGGGAVWQSLVWGSARIEIVPCAGHSPDSVCFRIGGLLFIGDLLVASRPLIAGLHGWNLQQLKQSLEGIIRLLEEGTILWCCPGHGDPLPAEKTLDLLRRQRDKASHAGEVEAMGTQRLFQTVDMALELIDEAEEVFSAIAGRLLYVADRLEMLEEPETARRCREAMDMEAMDALLETFRGLCRALSAGEMLQVTFAVEATGIVEKIRKQFAPESLGAILPAALVNRAQRLLLDFIGIAQGVRNLEEYIPIGIGALLAEVETVWNASPHFDEARADTVDDSNLFAAELARRIGHPPPAQRIPVRINNTWGVPPVPVAAARFCDTLIQFLEWLGLAGAGSIDVGHGVHALGQFVEIRVARGVPDESPRVRAKRQSFARRFALAGFALETSPEHFRLIHRPT